jgi:hypothetical protein
MNRIDTAGKFFSEMRKQEVAKMFRRRSLFAAAGLVLAAAAVAAAAQPAAVISQPEQRTRLQLTVYNQDLGLVREIRGVPVPQGDFRLEFQGVPSQVQPKTLLVEVRGGTGLTVNEQNFEFDLMSREKILEKYVGCEVAWAQKEGGRIVGRLLGIANGPVYEVNGEIVFEMPGRIVLPALPSDLRAWPTLVWGARAERAGEAEIDASYLTGGLSWAADYVLQLNTAGTEGGLQAWVSVDNRSGATYPDATLMLVAGDIHRAPTPEPSRAMMAKMETYAMDAGGVTEEALYDYHLYTVNWPTTLKDNQTKQVSLFEAEKVKVQRQYTTRAESHMFRRGGDFEATPQPVVVTYSFENRQDNQLGVPMPAGVVRIYGQAESGSRQLLGEDRIGHTPRDERIDLTAGTAFDIVAERLQKDYQRVSDRVHRATHTITLRNHKAEEVTVHVQEMVGGDWEVLEQTHPYTKLGAQALEFVVKVPRDGETVVTYTVQVTY